MARLKMAQRRALSKSDFVFPAKAPGHGSYPIPDRAHAAAALAYSKGTPQEAAVAIRDCEGMIDERGK